ncbi:MAG: ATP-binding protein, partial [Limisphaerales bacterium]
LLAYVGKTASGEYKPFYYTKPLMTADVELSEEMFIITKETAEAYLKTRVTSPAPAATSTPAAPTSPATVPVVAVDLIPPPIASSANSGLTWTGEIPAQKWMNFYTKVLSKFATARGLKLTVKVEVAPEGGVSKQKLDETKSALRELGLNDDVAPK